LCRFKRKVQQEDIIHEVKRQSLYPQPGERLHVKKALAVQMQIATARKEQVAVSRIVSLERTGFIKVGSRDL
jgi:small subunit ribosomal protein S21